MSTAITFPPTAHAIPLRPRAAEMIEKYVVNDELVVPHGYIFAMGDNRDDSDDSRYWGLVPRENIVGSPVVIYWSFEAPTAGKMHTPSDQTSPAASSFATSSGAVAEASRLRSSYSFSLSTSILPRYANRRTGAFSIPNSRRSSGENRIRPCASISASAPRSAALKATFRASRGSSR